MRAFSINWYYIGSKYGAFWYRHSTRTIRPAPAKAAGPRGTRMTPAVETAAPDRMPRREFSKRAVAGAPISPALAFIAARSPYAPPDRDIWKTAPLSGTLHLQLDRLGDSAAQAGGRPHHRPGGPYRHPGQTRRPRHPQMTTLPPSTCADRASPPAFHLCPNIPAGGSAAAACAPVPTRHNANLKRLRSPSWEGALHRPESRTRPPSRIRAPQ